MKFRLHPLLLTNIFLGIFSPVSYTHLLGHGVVNGFFDLEEHKTDAKYAELISKATHKYCCVRGERMMFYFHRLKMLDAAPTEILRSSIYCIGAAFG